MPYFRMTQTAPTAKEPLTATCTLLLSQTCSGVSTCSSSALLMPWATWARRRALCASEARKRAGAFRESHALLRRQGEEAGRRDGCRTSRAQTRASRRLAVKVISTQAQTFVKVMEHLPGALAPQLRVRLLSGAIVYDGPSLRDLAALRLEVARFGLARPDELVFCRGDAVLARVEDGGEVVAVRDPTMGLLDEFLRYVRTGRLSERFRPACEHRSFMLSAVARYGCALRHASAELRADRDVVLTAVVQDGYALQFASAEFRADPDVVLAAVAQTGFALQYASAELRADRDLVLAAVARDGCALGFAPSAADPMPK